MEHKRRLQNRLTGEQIRRHILLLGMTYDELAQRLGLASSRVIYEWVNGNKTPSVQNLLNLSYHFHVLLEDILVTEDIL